jgi:hypothetical protein
MLCCSPLKQLDTSCFVIIIIIIIILRYKESITEKNTEVISITKYFEVLFFDVLWPRYFLFYGRALTVRQQGRLTTNSNKKIRGERRLIDSFDAATSQEEHKETTSTTTTTTTATTTTTTQEELTYLSFTTTIGWNTHNKPSQQLIHNA